MEELSKWIKDLEKSAILPMGNVEDLCWIRSCDVTSAHFQLPM